MLGIWALPSVADADGYVFVLGVPQAALHERDQALHIERPCLIARTGGLLGGGVALLAIDEEEARVVALPRTRRGAVSPDGERLAV